MRTVLIVLALIGLTACNTKGSYKAVQQGQKTQCQSLLVSSDEYQRCVEQYEMPYEDYQSDREAIQSE